VNEADRVESSIVSPAPGWAKRLPRDESLFLWLLLVTGIFMSLFAIGWVYWYGNQNVPDEGYRTTPAAFRQQLDAFVAEHRAPDGRVRVPPGTDAFMMATRYSFFPELVLKAGEPYRIWMSAADVLHGYSIVGGTLNYNLQLAPEHAFGVEILPEEPGEYLIVCNEYCGLGHQDMKGRIVVEP
jgi:cytochrome c oxidase subunit 2